MDIGANRQVQSPEISPAQTRSVEEVGAARRTGSGAGSDTGRQESPAATVELSGAAVDATQEANRAAAAAAAVGLNAVDAANETVQVEAPSIAANTGGGNANAEAAVRASSSGGGASRVQIGGAARQMATGAGAEVSEVGAPVESPTARGDIEGASASADGADPGISEDNLGVVEDAGRPN